jgi:hypothetical protein
MILELYRLDGAVIKDRRLPRWSFLPPHGSLSVTAPSAAGVALA